MCSDDAASPLHPPAADRAILRAPPVPGEAPEEGGGPRDVPAPQARAVIDRLPKLQKCITCSVYIHKLFLARDSRSHYHVCACVCV